MRFGSVKVKVRKLSVLFVITIQMRAGQELMCFGLQKHVKVKKMVNLIFFGLN